MLSKFANNAKFVAAAWVAIVLSGCGGMSGGIATTAASLAGNAGGSASVTIITPADMSSIGASSVSAVVFSGACSINDQVVLLNIGTVNSTTTCHNLSWTSTLDLSPLAEGKLQVVAHHGVASGSITTTTIQLTKKTTLPTISITSPAASSAIPAGQMSAFIVTGICSENGQKIAFTGDGKGLTACNNGTFSGTVDFSAAANGAVSLVATIVDIAGNTATGTRSFGKNVSGGGGGGPTLTLTSPSGTTYISAANKTNFAVSGTCSENG